MGNKWKIIIFIVIVGLLVYGYIYEGNKSNIIENPKYSKQELLEMEIEELKEEISNLEEERDDLSDRLDSLQHEYDYAEELIELLQDQLESYGIEPYEL